MPLTVDYGRRVETIDGRPHVVETIATRASNHQPARVGYRPVSNYTSRALGQMTVWARSFEVYPTGEQEQ